MGENVECCYTHSEQNEMLGWNMLLMKVVIYQCFYFYLGDFPKSLDHESLYL